LTVQEAEQNLRWHRSLEEARDEARRDGKLVLIYLWHHNCGGSKTMEAETYPDGGVQAYTEQHFVPVRFNVLERPEVAERFNSGWTPTIIVEDAEGREHRRSQGYLDPERFIGEVALARLMDAIDRRDFEAASDRLEEGLERTRDDPAREPEALYWSAVVAFRLSGERKDLTEGWDRLLDEFPQSEWAKRAGYVRQQ
jgi:uncharacterized protein YyaL (SSP411 family)